MKVALFCITLGVAVALGSATSLRGRHGWDEQMRGMFHMMSHKASKNATFKALLEEHFNTFDQAPEGKMAPYQCDLPRSPASPTTAHAVRPGDINVIASLGDSITAGYGVTAQSVIEVLYNDRHFSWVTGGVGTLNGGVTTLTNILRTFNGGLVGYSYDESWAEDREAGLNVAVGGDTAEGMLAQAEFLVQKMKDSSYGVDYENDWKLVSLFIGCNDLCRYCFDENFYSPEAYANYIRQALDLLHAEMPKTIVMVSNMFDVTPLPAFSNSLICDLVQTIACSCAEEKDMMQLAQRGYVEKVSELINSGRYDTGREDFTVVLMDHFNKAVPLKKPGTEEPDSSYWSPDCFHPGRKAHSAFATSLWNQLFEPVGQKREDLDWQIATNLVCPTEADPYIKTNINSRK